MEAKEALEPFDLWREGKCALCGKRIEFNSTAYAREHHIFCSEQCAMQNAHLKP